MVIGGKLKLKQVELKGPEWDSDLYHDVLGRLPQDICGRWLLSPSTTGRESDQTCLMEFLEQEAKGLQLSCAYEESKRAPGGQGIYQQLLHL